MFTHSLSLLHFPSHPLAYNGTTTLIPFSEVYLHFNMTEIEIRLCHDIYVYFFKREMDCLGRYRCVLDCQKVASQLGECHCLAKGKRLGRMV